MPGLSRLPSPRIKVKSPPASPGEERDDPIAGQSRTQVAFVPFDVRSSSGVNQDVRRAVRVQAARASAATRKRTIANKLAGRRSISYDESTSTAVPKVKAVEVERGRQRSLPRPVGSIKRQANTPPSPVRPVTGEELEPLRPYPVSQWHPQIPALVVHFLKYFAPEGASRREELRTELWPEALNNSALFHAILLTAASHASVSRAQQVPVHLLAQFKRVALESINGAIARSEADGGIGDPVIGAIALLGEWELVYGTRFNYETHMRGLETIVSLRGGLYPSHPPQPGPKPLPRSIITLILNTGHDLALYASKRPYFESEAYPDSVAAFSVPKNAPQAFLDLASQLLLLPSLLQPVASLASITPQDPIEFHRLEEFHRMLSDWSLAAATRANYCTSQTQSEDNIKTQLSALVRLAGLASCVSLQIGIRMPVHARLPSIYEETLQISIEVLVHTIYEEVAFWALFSICAITGRCEARHMRFLKRMQLELGLLDWSAMRGLLMRYVYPAVLLEDRAWPLWEAVSCSVIGKDITPCPPEPTRFAKGVRHPTTDLGDAIDAEES